MNEVTSLRSHLKGMLQKYPAEEIGESLSTLEYERVKEIVKGMHTSFRKKVIILREQGRIAEACILDGTLLQFAVLITDFGKLDTHIRRNSV